MRLLLISLLAFAAGLAVWIARGDDTPAAPRPERPVLTGTSGDIPKLQRAVRERPRRPSPRARRRLPAASARDRRPVLLRARPRASSARRARPRRCATAGELALARHDFRGALALGQRAGAIGAPIRVDALVELGRYDDAARELQAMLDRKPNLAGYARASYLRELRGDLAGRRRGDAPRRRRRRPGGRERRLRRRAARRARAAARTARRRAARVPSRRSRSCPATRAPRPGSRGSTAASAIAGCGGSSSGSRCPST